MEALPDHDDYDPIVIKRKLLHHLKRVDDIQGSMKNWFVNAQHWEDIKRDNFKKLFAYAVWYKTMDQMAAGGLEGELEDLVCQLECHAGRKVPAGYNADLRFMSHLWDPLRHVYRPLLFYVVMELLAGLCHVVLAAAGFQLQQLGGIGYYTLRMGQQQLQVLSKPLASQQQQQQRQRQRRSQQGGSAAAAADPSGGSDGLQQQQQHHRSQQCDSSTAAVAAGSSKAAPVQQQQQDDADDGSLPILFLHGVGAGLLPYLSLVFHLASLGRPMILPESKHVSMRLVKWLPTVDDMADGTAAILAAHGVDRALVVAHSYGTMVAARMVLKYESLVHSLCLMDPVCFAMFMPHLIRNFMYAWHVSGCLLIDVIMALVSSELHCASTFSRKFFWTSINLWDEHVPARTLVVLSGRDILSPTNDMHTWLREHTPAQVLYKPGMAHAGILVNTAWQATVIEAFLQVIKRPGGSKAAAAAVAAAEAPGGSAEDVSAAAAVQQQQQSEGGRCGGKGAADAGAAAAAQQQQQQDHGIISDSAVDESSSSRAEQARHGRSSAASSAAAEASSTDASSSSFDTDDSAWEAMDHPDSLGSCSGRLA
uniref:AB hydrolase-1 domain-containing protein n=1 Tax=Tetradesmus obliquus TaxID=3088 RepID=A0A383VKF9_TETOB|eukprot:jgi/Sobl393_1/12153/SZX64856.1